MCDACKPIGANLGSVSGTDENLFRFTCSSFEFGKVFGDELGMVKAAGANMAINGRKGNDDGWFVSGWKEGAH